jgi:hypothetical protein
VLPDLAHERVLELLKLSSNVNECQPPPASVYFMAFVIRFSSTCT